MPANTHTHTPSPSASVFRTADTDVDWNATQQSVSALSRCCNDGEGEERGQAWLCTGEDTAVWRQCPKSHTTLTESRRGWERRAHAEAYATRRPALREGQFAIIKKIQQNKKISVPASWQSAVMPTVWEVLTRPPWDLTVKVVMRSGGIISWK